MGALFIKGSNKEFFWVFFDVEWGWGLGGGSEDNIGEGEDFTLILIGVLCVELVGLSLSKYFSKEHDCW